MGILKVFRFYFVLLFYFFFGGKGKSRVTLTVRYVKRALASVYRPWEVSFGPPWRNCSEGRPIIRSSWYSSDPSRRSNPRCRMLGFFVLEICFEVGFILYLHGVVCWWFWERGDCLVSVWTWMKSHRDEQKNMSLRIFIKVVGIKDDNNRKSSIC